MNDVAEPAAEIPKERSLLIVEDDRSFLQRLAKALEQRGFAVTTAESVADGLLQVEKSTPAFAIVDMRLGDGNGLDVIRRLKEKSANSDDTIRNDVVLIWIEQPRIVTGADILNRLLTGIGSHQNTLP